jgi:hypothetical protein
MARIRTVLPAIAVILALGLPLGLAGAQTGPGAPPNADQGRGYGPGAGYGPGMMGGRGGYGWGPGMMGGRSGYGPGAGMMGWMYGAGDDGALIDYVEGRLAFVKAELKITAQQASSWDKFAEAVRANAKTINERRKPFIDRAYWSEPLPQRLEQQEKVMAAHLDALRQTSAAVKPLYAALDDAQKKTADALLGSPMMGMLGLM